MASASIFLSLPAASSVERPYLSMYGVWFSCLGGSTHRALLNRVESKAFHLINSPPLTDCLDSLNHQGNVESSSLFYRQFHADYSSELANSMPLPLPRPRCTRLSTSSHPYFIHFSNARLKQYLSSSLTLVNFGTFFYCFPPAYELNSFKREKRSVKTPLILNWISTPCLYFSYCLLYRVW